VGDVTLSNMAINRPIGMKGLGLTSDSSGSGSGNFDFGDLEFTGPAEEGQAATGDESFEPRGVGFVGRLSVANPSTTGVELGDTSFDILVPQGIGGDGELVKFGEVTLEGLSMVPGGSSSLTVTGQLGPLPAGPEGDVSGFLAGYLRKDPSVVVARGAVSASSPVWKQRLVERLALSMALPHVPSVSTDGLVSNITSEGLSIKVQEETVALMGTSLFGNIGSPFGGSTAMQLQSVSLTVSMSREENGRNVTLAQLNTAKIQTPSAVNLLSMDLTDVPLLLEGDGSAFGRLAASLLESPSGASVFLKGAMEVGVVTDLGVIESLPDIPVDLALSLPSFSFNNVGSPSLQDLQITDSTERRDALAISAGASFTNPATGTLDLGPAEFDLFASGERIATLQTDDLNLSPGNVTLTFTGEVAPRNKDELFAISTFVNGYLGSGPPANLTITGSELRLFSRRLFLEEKEGGDGGEGRQRRLQTREPARWVRMALSAFSLTIAVSPELLGGDSGGSSDLIRDLEIQGLAFNFDREMPSLSGAVTVQYALPTGISVRHAIRSVECDLELAQKGAGKLVQLEMNILGPDRGSLEVGETFKGQFRDVSMDFDAEGEERMSGFVRTVIFEERDPLITLKGTGKIRLETEIGTLQLDGVPISSARKINSMAGTTFSSDKMRTKDMVVVGGSANSLLLEASLEIDYEGELSVFLGDLFLDLYMPFSPFDPSDLSLMGPREVEALVSEGLTLSNQERVSGLVKRNEFDLSKVSFPATPAQLTPGPRYPPSLEPRWDLSRISHMIKIGTVTIEDLRLITGRTNRSKIKIEMIPPIQDPKSAERTGPQQLVSRYISQMFNVVMLRGRPDTSSSPLLSSLEDFRTHTEIQGADGKMLADTSMSVNIFPPSIKVFPTLKNPFPTKIGIYFMYLDIYDGEQLIGWTREVWDPSVELEGNRQSRIRQGLDLEIAMGPATFVTVIQALSSGNASVKVIGKIGAMLEGYSVVVDYKDDDVAVDFGS